VIGNNGSGKTNLVRFLSPFVSKLFDKEVAFGSAEITFQGKYSSVLKMQTDEVISATETGGQAYFFLKFYDLPVAVEGNDWKSVLEEIEQHEDLILYSKLIEYGIPSKIGLWNTPLHSTVKLKNGKITLNEQRRLLGFGLKDFSDHSFVDAFTGLISTESLTAKEFESHIRAYCSDLCSTLSNITKLFSPVSNIQLSPDSSFKYNETTNEFSIYNLHFEFYSEGNWRKFTELSDGTKRILFILSELSLSDYRFTDEEYARLQNIIFLEEPEIGIHPHQLYKLINFLREEAESKQIILTTHSPQVLNILPPEELFRIIICEYDNEKGTQFRHMTDDEMNYAREYMKKQFLSDFWLHSGFNDDIS
ncbi:MAG: AAA family ATPase, partial [Bacteroidia bacterium]